MKLDWRYHRPGVERCTKAQEFLARNNIEDGGVQSASKEPIEGEAVLLLLAEMSVLIVARGKKTILIDLTEGRPSDSELLEMLLGRSGKLRAPAMLIENRVLIGYNSVILTDELLTASLSDTY